MVNKALRILIADKQPAQRRAIEQMLNGLGYYCVATATSYQELAALTAPPVHPFDLLIVDALLAAYEGVNLGHFCQFNSHVFHSLIYRDYRIGLIDKLTFGHQAVCASLEKTPDLQSVAELMEIIDAFPPVWNTLITHGVSLGHITHDNRYLR